MVLKRCLNAFEDGITSRVSARTSLPSLDDALIIPVDLEFALLEIECKDG